MMSRRIFRSVMHLSKRHVYSAVQHRNISQLSRVSLPYINRASWVAVNTCRNVRLFASKAGQPLPETHPYLMHPDEITPGVSRQEYEQRRAELFAKMPVNSVAIVPGYRTRYASCNVFYPFRQSSDLFYLTGFNEPDAIAVFEKRKGYQPSTPEEMFRLFLRPSDQHAELWDGPRAGLNGARTIFGADEAIDSSLFNVEFAKMVKQFSTLYYDLPKDVNLFGESILNNHRSLTARRVPLAPIIHKMRQIKSPAEIKLMQQAGDITGQAFRQVIASTRPGMIERELDARMDYECRRRGAERQAYVPVVAGGRNALTMHYVQNDMPLESGDLILMDAGSEYHGYASDVTRTWPVNGKFTLPQRQLYQAVLNVQKTCIEMCTEEKHVTLNNIHRQSVITLKSELNKLGWTASINDIEHVLYPHHVGHYLGLDIHDTYSLDRSSPLKAGMVITIEPGIYVPESSKFPEQYQGIGIRIEDDILIGQDKPIVLSRQAPKEIDEIEQLLSEDNCLNGVH